jgi:hypothetical protein
VIIAIIVKKTKNIYIGRNLEDDGGILSLDRDLKDRGINGFTKILFNTFWPGTPLKQKALQKEGP